MDRKLILGAFVLFCLQVLWLLDDMNLIRLTERSRMSSSTQSVGEVVVAQKNVKRRSADSLVWEESQARDLLYYYDSVLTLKQSGATLKIEGDTQIKLAENTLVVLEPTQKKDVDRLRLVFSKGDMRAVSQGKTGEYQLNTWTVEAEKGAEVHVRSQEDGKMDVELLKGEARLLSSQQNKAHEIKQGELITLDQEKIQSVQKIDESLKWQGNDVRRVYHHQFPVSVSLDWQGEANELVVTPRDGPARTFDVSARKNLAASFDVGQYQLRLKNKNMISEAISLQVWQAPVIHLLYPLPRDRLDLRETHVFSWTKVPEAKSYRLQLQGGAQPFEKVTSRQMEELKFTGQPGSYTWQVEAIDHDGFHIPSRYSNPLFFVEDPLAAPKLKPIRIRRPAGKKDDQSFLFKLRDLVLPQAWAAPLEEWEVDFEWEEVKGADRYTIEISDQPGFQHLVHTERTVRPKITWTMKQKGTFYWRVAAGTSDGKMGIFSQAQKFSVTDEFLKNDEDNGGVAIRKKVVPTPVPKPTSTPTPTPTPKPSPTPTPVPKATPTPTPEPEDPSPSMRSEIWFGPSAEYLAIRGTDSTQAKGTGLSYLNAGASVFWPHDKKYGSQITFRYNQSTWKPNPPSDYPFQDNLKDWSVRSAFYFRKYMRTVNWGVAVNRVSLLERKELESATLAGRIIGGPGVYFDWSRALTSGSHGEWTLTGDGKLFELALTNHLGWQFYDPLLDSAGFSVGFQFNAVATYGAQIPFGYRLQSIFYLGISF